MFKKKVLIISLILLTILTLILKTTSSENYSYQKYQNALGTCSNLSSKEKTICGTKIISQFAKHLPIQKLIDYQNKLNRYNSVYGNCHELSHYLGTLGYLAFKKGITTTISSCGGGFAHGFLESATENKDQKAINYIIKTFCNTDSSSEIQCIHGFGHNLAQNAAPLPSALTLCNLVNLKHLTQKIKDYFCIDGYVMEQYSDRGDPRNYQAYQKNHLYTFQELNKLCDPKKFLPLSPQPIAFSVNLCLSVNIRYLLIDQYLSYSPLLGGDPHSSLLTKESTLNHNFYQFCSTINSPSIEDGQNTCFNELGNAISDIGSLVFNYQYPPLSLIFKSTCLNNLDCQNGFFDSLLSHDQKITSHKTIAPKLIKEFCYDTPNYPNVSNSLCYQNGLSRVKLNKF